MEGAKTAEGVTEGRPKVSFPFGEQPPRTIGCPTDPSMVSYVENPMGGSIPPAALFMTATYYDPLGREGLSKFAYTDFNPAYQATDTNPLFVATELTNCASNPPRRVDLHEGVPAWRIAMLPRFSLDGSRLSYLEYNVDANKAEPSVARRLVTVDPSGNGAAHEVRRGIMAGSNVVLLQIPPTWYVQQGTLGIAWAEQLANGVTIRAAPDENLPLTEALVSCPDGLFWELSQISVLGSGGLVAMVGRLDESDAAQTIYLVVQGAECSLARPPQQLHPEDGPDTSSFDMAVSPDGTRLAHVSDRPGPPAANRVWISPVAGGAPLQCGDGALDTYDLGPQWVSDTRLLWTRLPSSGTDGLVGDIMVATVDAAGTCSDVAPLLPPPSMPGETSRVLPNNSGSCGVGAVGPPGRSGWTPFAALLAAGWVRRRSSGRRSRGGPPPRGAAST